MNYCRYENVSLKYLLTNKVSCSNITVLLNNGVMLEAINVETGQGNKKHAAFKCT